MLVRPPAARLLSVAILLATAIAPLAPGLDGIPAASAADPVGCQNPAPLFEEPERPLRTRIASAYPGITQWYEHEPENGSATYTLAPLVGTVQLEVFDRCGEEAVCEREPVQPGQATRCTVDRDRVLVAVTGTDAPHQSLGVTFAIRQGNATATGS